MSYNKIKTELEALVPAEKNNDPQYEKSHYIWEVVPGSTPEMLKFGISHFLDYFPKI